MFFHADNKTLKVAIYIRVSTQDQEVEGYGLESQRKRLLEFVEQSNGKLETNEHWIYSDTHTGSDINRKNLSRLLEDVQAKKFDAVLVWKIDRLSRNLTHLLHLFDQFEKAEVSFISLQENLDFRGPMGKLIFQIFGAIAQFEKELIKGRTRSGIIASAEMGNYIKGTVPFGYKAVKNNHGKGKKLEIVEEEKEWVKQIFHWYIYDRLGWGGIAKKLNELKVSHSKNSKNPYKKWTEKEIRILLQTTEYYGEYRVERHDVEDLKHKMVIVEVPACITRYVFEMAQKVRTEKPSGKMLYDYLLSGKMWDMSLPEHIVSNRKFVGARRTKGGFSYRRKQFTDSTTGEYFPVFEVTGQQLDEYVWSKVKEALKDPQRFIESYLSEEYINKDNIQEIERKLHDLEKKEAEIELKLFKAQDSYVNGVFSLEALQRQETLNNEDLEHVRNNSRKLKEELEFISSVDMEINKLKSASESVKFRLDEMDNKGKKLLISLFVDRIELCRVNVPGQKKPNITVNVCFRFNPEEFENADSLVRTEEGLPQKKNTTKNPLDEDSGAARRN